MPHLSLEKEAEKLKGSPLNEAEKTTLEERALYVRAWLKQWAPETERFEILSEIPSDLVLSDEQKETLLKLKDVFSNEDLLWEGAPIHEAIHAVKEDTGISPKEIFQPLYKMFLGRTSGPQVGWFLSTFPREDVIRKLDAALM
jgi:lysyl-tRNA synthetase class I